MGARQTYITLITFLFLTWGCRPAGDDPAGSSALRDALGRDVPLERPIRRVVTLAPSITEIVFAAGAGSLVVGVGEIDNYPPAVRDLPRFSTYPVDFEAVAALEPDLAIASDQVNNTRDAETLAALGIPTYFLASQKLNDVLTGIETVGRLLGTDERAAAAVDSLKAEIEALRQTVGRAHHRPEVLFLIGMETPFSFGSESYMHDLIELAGGESVTGDIRSVAPVLSEEFVVSRGPEVVMGPWGPDTDPAELLRFHPSWDALPAVRNGRVYGVEADLVERPGPRLVAGARAMAKLLHPELFGTE